MPAFPSLNIQSSITRAKGTVGVTTRAPGIAELAKALDDVQIWANTISNQVQGQAKLISDISPNDSISFGETSMVVSVNQATNQLVFKVQYSDGTIKTGTVALV